MKSHTQRKLIAFAWWLALLIAITGIVCIGTPRLNTDFHKGTPNDWWQAFDRATTALGYLLAVTAIYAGLDGLINKDSWLRRLVPTRKYLIKRDKESTDIEKSTEALILLHHRNDSAMSIVNLVNPRIVLLITTSSDNAINFASSFNDERRKFKSDIELNDVEFMEPIVVSNKGSSTEARESTTGAIEAVMDRGCERDRIVVDITGTTKPMSIGAFEAADAKGVSTIYMESDYDYENRRIEGSERALYVRKYYSS